MVQLAKLESTLNWGWSFHISLVCAAEHRPKEQKVHLMNSLVHPQKSNMEPKNWRSVVCTERCFSCSKGICLRFQPLVFGGVILTSVANKVLQETCPWGQRSASSHGCGKCFSWPPALSRLWHSRSQVNIIGINQHRIHLETPKLFSTPHQTLENTTKKMQSRNTVSHLKRAFHPFLLRKSNHVNVWLVVCAGCASLGRRQQ